MFEIGDYIIYGNHGVCRVEDIVALIFGVDQSKKCYTLHRCFPNQVLYIPCR